MKKDESLKYDVHVFVCENVREPNNPIGCCAHKGSPEITKKLKELVQKSPNKSKKIRINKCGCLGQCKEGPVLVVYPKGDWYENVTLDDVDAIYQKMIEN